MQSKEYCNLLFDLKEDEETSLRWIAEECNAMKNCIIKKPKLLNVDNLVKYLDRWIDICDLEYVDEINKKLDELFIDDMELQK